VQHYERLALLPQVLVSRDHLLVHAVPLLAVLLLLLPLQQQQLPDLLLHRQLHPAFTQASLAVHSA
jgi:hypothetical protein